jgi:hypothetical protein
MGEFEPLQQGGLVCVIFGKHAHKEMKVVVHEAVPQDFREIDPGKMKDQPLQCVLVRTIKGKSGQGGTGDDVVDGRGFGHEQSGNAGHGDLRYGE